MAIHTLTLKDGSTLQVEAPRGTPVSELVGLANQQSRTADQQALQNRQQERQAFFDSQRPEYAAIPEPETGFFGDITSGFGTGFVETGEMAALGAATLLDEEAELAARGKIQSVADAIKPSVREGDKDDIAFKIGQTFGSIAGFAVPIAGAAAAAPAAIPAAAVGTGIGALLGVGAAAGEASERARAAGTTEEQRNLAIRQAAPVGLLEVAPLGRFMRSVDIPVIGQFIKDLGPETVETIGQRIQNAAITGGGEAAQEVTAEIVQNLAERGYNPERAITEGTGESALYGGGAGATIQFLVDAFTNSRKAGPQGETPLQIEGETPLQITDQREPAQVEPPEGIAGLLEAPRAALPAPAKQLPAPRTEVTPEGQAITPEQRSAQLEQERLEEAELNRMLAEDEPIVADMPPRDVREGQARLRAEEARAAETRQVAEATPAPEDDGDIAAELARLDAREAATRIKRAQDRPVEEAEARRAGILSDVLAGTTTASQVNTERAFSKALADQGIARVEPTKDERAAIARKTYEVAAQRPEAPVEAAVEAPSEAPVPVKDPAQEALEARVAPRDRPAVQPSFPGMGRKADLGVAPAQEGVAETPAAPTAVDETFLNELGVPKAAPIRKRVLGKDFNAPEVRQQFATLAGNKNTSGTLKANINRALGDVSEAQGDLPLFPRRGAKPAADITPLNKPALSNVDLGQLLEVPRVASQEAKPAASGRSVPSPVGDVGARPARSVPSPAPAVEATGEPTAPRDSRLGSPVVEPRVPDGASRAERDALERNAIVGRPDTPEAKRGPIPAAVKSSERKDAEKKVVDRETAAKKVRAELKTRWEAQATDVAKREYADTENQVKGDPFTTAENRKILKLLETPIKSREKDALDAVVTYLGLYPNPAEGLYLAMQDVAMGTPQSRGDPLLKGTGGKAAGKAVKWAQENLDSNGKEWVRKSVVAIQKDLMGVADADLTVAQLKEQGITDAVQMQREKEALEAEREEAEAMLEAETQDNESFDIERQLGFTRIKIDKLLKANAVVGLDLPLHPSVGASIKAGELSAALSALAGTSPSAQVQNIAAKLADVVGDTKLVTKKDLKAADGRPVAGMFDPETNTITLDEGTGINAHTLIHEMTHAAASATLSNKAHPLTKQITKLFENVKEYLDTAYGAQNVDEFFSEAMSNPDFRTMLATINVKGEPISALRRFLNSTGNFVRRLMGRPTTPLDAMETVDTFVDGLLAPAPQYRNSGQLLMSSTADGAKKVLDTLVSRTQKKFGTPEARKDFRRQFGDDSVEFLQSGVADNAKKLLLKLTGSQAMADIAKAAGLGNLGYKLDRIINEQRGGIRIANEQVKREIDKVVSWVDKVSDAKKETLDRLIYNDKYGATIYQVDPTLTAAEAKKRYAKDSDKMAVWNEQRKDWNALGADGQRTYKIMRDNYRNQYEKMRAVIFGEIDELMADNPEAATKLKNEVYGKLFDKGTLDVYFPLIREGQYKLTYAAKNPASDREAYVVEMFTTKRERDRAAAEVRADKEFTGVETFDGEMTNSDFKNAPPASFVAQTLRTLSANGVDGDVQTQIMRLFVNALPETSFAKSLQKRKGTPGYLTDSVYAMKSKAYDLAGQTEKLKYAAVLRSLEREIVEQVTPEGGAKAKSRLGKTAQATRASFEDVKDELLNRSKFAREGAERKDLEAYGRRLNQTAFIFTIGFNVSSALVNLSQVPLFVMPFLGGKYGYKETGIAVKEAGSIVASSKNSILENYNIRDDGVMSVKKDLDVPAERRKELEDLAPLVALAAKRGQLGQGYLAEALGLEESGRVSRGGKVGAIMDNISVLSAFAFNHGEQFNRQVTLVTAYKLALQKLAKDSPNMTRTERMDKAAEMAIYEAQETNGGSFLETAPPIAREGLGRVAFMYKSYGLQMYYSMLKAAKTAFDSDKGKLFGPEGSPERKAAWKQLIGLHGTALFFAGIQGVPLYGAVQLVADLFFLDDEEDDFDTIVRKYVGEGWYKGAITNFSGIDVAGRTALTGLLIQENRYNNDPSLEENLGHYLGGPALSVAKRLGRGVSDLASGETQRGIENMMPVAIANAYKGTFGRYADQGGAFTRRGDPIYDDMTAGEMASQVLGFPPTEYTFRQEQNMISKRIDISVGKKRSGLHKKYYVAMRLGDFDAADSVFDEIMKFNERHPEAAITPNSIERSMNQHAKTSTEMYNGVTLSPLYRRTLEQLRSEYSQ